MRARWIPLLLAATGCSDPPPAAPDAAARAPVERPRPSKPPPPAQPAEPAEPPEPRPRAVPLESASDLRSAIRGASDSMSALWTLVDAGPGLSVYRVDDGTARDICHLEEAGPRDFPYMLDSGDRWSCDEALGRCTSVDVADGSGYAFYFRVSGEHRRLAAIVRYGRRVPAEDPAEIAAFVGAAGSVCRLRTIVEAAAAQAPAESGMPTTLWRYRHPLQGADIDDAPEHGDPEERRLCGAEARRAAAALLHELGALGKAHDCSSTPLSCTYSGPLAERRLIARLDASGRPVPWVIAELASLPSPPDAARQERDVAAFLQRAEASDCP